MLAAIAQSMPLAMGIVISSVPLMVVTLTLLMRQNKGAVLAFLLGWMGGIALLGSMVLLLAEGTARDPQTSPAWLPWTRVVVGLLLLVLAAKQWRSRPRNGATAQPPAWMKVLDALTVAKAGGLGLLLTTVNPKNFLLVASGAMAIIAADPGSASSTAQWIALAVFTAVASLGVAAPALMYLALGERAVQPLAQAKTWIVQNNAGIMCAVLTLLGFVVLGNGLAQL